MVTLTWVRVERRGNLASHWEADPARYSIWRVRNAGTGGKLMYELLPGTQKFNSLPEAKKQAQLREDNHGNS